ncbi:hypothetical protein PMAYCL1PPCAC_01214, partial [Pristionchus mayeri]
VAYLDDSPIAGEGTLAIAESSVTWISCREGRFFSHRIPRSRAKRLQAIDENINYIGSPFIVN